MWAFALALALRCYTESVMTDYYLWPALASALVVGARCSNLRATITLVAAVVTTVTAQWYYTWLPWWLLDVGGITVVLAASAALPPHLPAPAGHMSIGQRPSHASEARPPQRHSERRWRYSARRTKPPAPHGAAPGVDDS